MIHTHALTKRYGTTLALDRLELTVPAGAAFGLLGPNGSGKSTLIRLLLGFIFPDAGTLALNGVVQRDIGFLPDRLAFPAGARAAEWLHLMGELGGLRGATLRARVGETLERVGLAEQAGWRITAYSKGMRQRLGLAQALLTEPRLLVLDEPMSGLDPAAQHHVREFLHDLHAQGTTLLFSTHRLADVTALCTHVAILSRGMLRRAGPLAEVLPLRPEVHLTVGPLPPALHARLAAEPGVTLGEGRIALHGTTVAHKGALLRALMDANVDIQRLEQQRATLEEVYLEALA